MNEFQKFLRVVDVHEKTDFFTLMTFFTPAIFSIHEILKNDQKMTGAKKVVKVENQLFDACQPCKGIFEICSY